MSLYKYTSACFDICCEYVLRLMHNILSVSSWVCGVLRHLFRTTLPFSVLFLLVWRFCTNFIESTCRIELHDYIDIWNINESASSLGLALWITFDNIEYQRHTCHKFDAVSRRMSGVYIWLTMCYGKNNYMKVYTSSRTPSRFHRPIPDPTCWSALAWHDCCEWQPKTVGNCCVVHTAQGVWLAARFLPEWYAIFSTCWNNAKAPTSKCCSSQVVFAGKMRAMTRKH